MKATKANLKTVAEGINPAAILNAEQTAEWLGLSKRTVLELVRKGRIPVMRLNDRVFRFHPPTVLARLGQTGGAR